MKISLSCREAALNTLSGAANASADPSPYFPGKPISIPYMHRANRVHEISLAPSPSLLFYHFFAVALYSIWIMFTHPRPILNPANSDKPRMVAPDVTEYPYLLIKSVRVVSTPPTSSLSTSSDAVRFVVSSGWHVLYLGRCSGQKYGGGRD